MNVTNSNWQTGQAFTSADIDFPLGSQGADICTGTWWCTALTVMGDTKSINIRKARGPICDFLCFIVSINETILS
jgi:hypothetical protein